MLVCCQWLWVKRNSNLIVGVRLSFDVFVHVGADRLAERIPDVVKLVAESYRVKGSVK